MKEPLEQCRNESARVASNRDILFRLLSIAYLRQAVNPIYGAGRVPSHNT